MKILPITSNFAVTKSAFTPKNCSFKSSNWSSNVQKTDFNGSGSEGNATLYTCKRYDNRGRVTEEAEYYVCSKQYMRLWKEYGYHPNGKYKFIYEHDIGNFDENKLNLHLPFLSEYRYQYGTEKKLGEYLDSIRFTPHNYNYTEYDMSDKIIKEICVKDGLYIENIYDETPYPLRTIYKNAFINDEHFDTVELLYRHAKEDEIPDRYKVIGGDKYKLVKLIGKNYMQFKDFSSELLSKSIDFAAKDKIRLVNKLR